MNGIARPLYPEFLRPLRRFRRKVASYMDARILERRALSGQTLVPEAALTDCYRQVLDLLRDRAGDAPLGEYLEFGVCHGASFACMHRATVETDLQNMRLFGFDSFAGLPPEAEGPDGGGIWREGQYRSSLTFTRNFLDRAGIDWSRVTLTKGWFKDTLTPHFAARHKIREASVIMMDCDIYSSTREALAFCEPLIGDRAIILFDDWHSGGDLAARNQGEKRAFNEFLARNPQLRAEALPSYTANAEVFLVERLPVERRRPAAALMSA